ncbi:type III pantothenate kinase [bacterium]|nr:type III pantothenate kinase [bacterium]
MLLSIDIGNTNITLGIFDNEALVETFRLASDKDLSQEEYELLFKTLCKDFQIDDCVIGSVVEELNSIIKKSCDNVFDIDSYLINQNSNFGMKVLLKNPKEIGIDRIANAQIAKTQYPLPAIVVDIGTATTFDVISKNGDFLGGVIMPGLNLQFKTLNSNTSKLPRINAGISEKAIGDSTENAILSGIMRGSACAIEGLIHQCELELGEKATIIATGGNSRLISEYMIRRFDYIDQYLTLKGLKYIYELNKNEVLVKV